MKQLYTERRFSADNLRLILTCDSILNEYVQQGYVITVRTLYYQLVSRDIIPNQEKSYKHLTGLINDARLAGLIDWDVIEDRGRRPVVRGRWFDGKAFLKACAPQFHRDLWREQENRVFVVVEKDALAGVLERTCHALDVPLLAAKGYPSVSSVRDLVHDEIFPHMFTGWKNRAKPGKVLPVDARQRIVFLHLGDHDPSGLDMSRDLEERLTLFGENLFHLDFKRIALNMDQVEELSPPPNPAKTTDSRFKGYQDEYGDESWELDALPPDYLNNLLQVSIQDYIDDDAWEKAELEITHTRQRLIANADKF